MIEDQIRKTKYNDAFLTEPIVDAIGAMQEARRLRKLKAKGAVANYNRQLDTLVEEVFLTLNYLEIDIDEFTDKLIEEASQYD